MKTRERKSIIKVRGGFSESIGIPYCTVEMQYEEFDNRTRMLISNTLFDALEYYLNTMEDHYRNYYNLNGNINVGHLFSKAILSGVFNRSTVIEDGYIFQWKGVFEDIENVITNAPYNEVLDMLWYINDWINENYISNINRFDEAFNKLFETEYVGYRFVDGKIVAITDQCEIDEIEQACHVPYNGCKAHIEKAVGFLADREHKDYKNCIKESISAVESVCRVITGAKNATLGDALKILESECNLKGQLKSAFEKLYAYTNNDKGGIRHAEGLFVSDVSFEEAKFMLVSCSAFVNYLIAEYGKVKKD